MRVKNQKEAKNTETPEVKAAGESADKKPEETKKQVPEEKSSNKDKEVKEPPKPTPESAFTLKEETPVETEVSISKYFALRGVKPQHRGGMKAFAPVQKATLTKWDEIFSRY